MTGAFRLAGVLLAAAGAGLGALIAASDDRDLDTLPAAQAIPALTQRMMDALPGDAAVWRRYLSDRAVFVDEAGEVATKAKLLEGFKPFPAGLSGSIQVRAPKITEFGDVAIAVFDAHEKERVYDQRLQVDYRSTYTWRRENGRWRLIAAQTVVLAKDPKALSIDAGQLDDYVGTYELAGKRRYRVERRGGAALVGGREGGRLTRLIAVGDNVFADGGSNLGILRIFVRGKAGRVARMVERRKFADLDWMRVSAAGANEKQKR